MWSVTLQEKTKINQSINHQKKVAITAITRMQDINISTVIALMLKNVLHRDID